MLEIRLLSVEYPGFRLRVENAAFDPGINIVIGPNGAGKTTMLEALLGVRKHVTADVSWNNERWSLPLRRTVKEQLAFLPDTPFLYKRKSLEFHRKYWSAMYSTFNDTAYSHYIDLFGLSSKKRANELSAGQRRLFLLALGLAYHPRLIVLDEPFAFLDPVQCTNVYSCLELYCSEHHGAIVIISSHLVHWLQELECAAIALQRGSVVAAGRLDKDYVSYFESTED